MNLKKLVCVTKSQFVLLQGKLYGFTVRFYEYFPDLRVFSVALKGQFHTKNMKAIADRTYHDER